MVKQKQATRRSYNLENKKVWRIVGKFVIQPNIRSLICIIICSEKHYSDK